ncbi:DNA oxidative demethylase ALKBH2 [Araneus ventricosus]|uniref:DNA oxidative demethylase ALKBH2 n=1 Tax=Araneus ventricosus TaxID=182803 RepID=A0A4Y2RRL1_ARAVE|nr:DNA oxidative demethylase ALKBH2 [Araneus ventricosus]
MAGFGEEGIQYTFSRKTFVAKPWTPVLRLLKENADTFLPDGQLYNYALVHLYKDGTHSISPHKDDEKDLDPLSPIVSFSFGEERKIIFRRKGYKKSEMNLEHGSVLVMKPPTNAFWTHEIPKQKNVVDARINVTFRRIF